jgi:exonuclease VII small subunit
MTTPQDDQILVKYTNELERAFNSYGKLESLLLEIQTKIEQLQEQYDKLVEDEYQVGNGAYAQFMDENFDILHGILKTNIQDAIGQSEEFSIPMYSSRLLEVVSTPEILEIVIDTSDPEVMPILLINILMDEFAGNIEDWANAVTAVRQNRGLGKVSRGDPAVGSAMFYEKYFLVDIAGKTVERTYKRSNKKKGIKAGDTVDITSRYAGKYLETISERLRACSTLAPFWSLLEYGNAPYPGGMSSDIGGLASPPQVPTHFIENSLSQIKEKATIAFSQIYNNLDKEFKTRLKNIQDIITGLEDLAGRVEEAMANFTGGAPAVGGGPTTPEFEDLISDPGTLYKTTEAVYDGLSERWNTLGKPLPETTEFKNKLKIQVARVGRGEVPGMRVSLGGGIRVRMTQVMRNASR